MTKVIAYGLQDEDKNYFEQQLTAASIEVDFQSASIDLGKLDEKAEVISVFVNTPVTREVIEHMPNLKLIATRSTGFNHIDLEAAKEHHVTVSNVPAYGGSTVAEYTFALLFMLTRRMTAVLAESTSDSPDRSLERGIDLHSKTIGVIGTGSIGRGVAQIAKGLGMEVLGYDVYPNEESARSIGFSYVDIDSLLAKSDVISLHIPSTAENYHFLNSEQLNKLKDGAIVINTARGELIDTAALADALYSHKVGAAGLDVLENEYLLNPKRRSETSSNEATVVTALLAMPNVIITNHNAFNTREAVQTINHVTTENIIHFFTNGEVHTVI